MASSHQLRANRPRAVLSTLGLIGLILFILFVLPFPHRTMVDGVTWPSDNSQIRMGADGFITEIKAENRAEISEGDVLVVSEDPFLVGRARMVRAQIATLQVQEAAVRRSDRVEAALAREEIAAAEAELTRIEEQIEALRLIAPRAGTMVIPNADDLIGQYIRKGALIGYVVDRNDTLAVRMMVDQDQIGLVRNKTRAIEIMPEGYDARPVTATILHETPGGSMSLPAPALGTIGGGEIPVDPRDQNGVRTLERYFEFELRVDDGYGSDYLGRRVRVKIDHGFEPVGFQIWRALRQLFLSLYGI